ncbi:MAG TPA: hypothetical protein VFB58_06625 [Chloroflexota bacterium]|nr:hypothetical protein [Chloroflexota bacterium]
MTSDQPTPAPAAENQGQPNHHAGLFTYVPHPHIHHRKLQGPVKVADQLDKSSPLARLNSRLALIITIAVGSMWAAYIFTVLALVSLPSAIQSHNTIIIVGWIAQTFLQLILLPVIIVGQNIQGAASDKRAQQTYNDAEAVLHEAVQIQAHLAAQDMKLQDQETCLNEIIATLAKAYPGVMDKMTAEGQG